MKIILTAAKKIELERQRKTKRDKRVAEMVKAVLLSAEGWTQHQPGQALGII